MTRDEKVAEVNNKHFGSGQPLSAPPDDRPVWPLGVNISRELHDAIWRRAKQEGRTRAKLVRELLWAALK